jgi:hypothetical protein
MGALGKDLNFSMLDFCFEMNFKNRFGVSFESSIVDLWWPDGLEGPRGSKIELSKFTPKTIRKCFPDLETVF